MKSCLALLLLAATLTGSSCGGDDEPAADTEASKPPWTVTDSAQAPNSGSDARSDGGRGESKGAKDRPRRENGEAKPAPGAGDARAGKGKKNVPDPNPGGPSKREGPKGIPGSGGGPSPGTDKPKTGSVTVEEGAATAPERCLRRAAREEGEARGRAAARCYGITYRAYRRQVVRACQAAKSRRKCVNALLGGS
jgi:hypothetical protein